MTRARLGTWGEAVARRHLEAEGYTIESTNWRSPDGEIDLVARVGPIVVFVEVKARTSDRYGRPEEAVTASKIERMQRIALAYLAAHDSLDVDWRIDVVAIDCHPDGKMRHLEHLVDVVTQTTPPTGR
jgi:putative endonuclease